MHVAKLSAILFVAHPHSTGQSASSCSCGNRYRCLRPRHRRHFVPRPIAYRSFVIAAVVNLFITAILFDSFVIAATNQSPVQCLQADK
jgi:hypothetical protein